MRQRTSHKADARKGSGIALVLVLYQPSIKELFREIKRKISSSNIKLGLDGGQGILKVTLSIMDKDERIKTGRQTYAEGVGVKENTSGSTNKLMVLALLYDAPETYETVKKMMEKLQVDNFPPSHPTSRCCSFS